MSNTNVMEMQPGVDHQLKADYRLLAELFTYPDDNKYKQRFINVYDYMLQHHPDAAADVALFREFMEDATLKDVQELFLRTFDVQAITTLDIGFILFGEDYKRGQLLVNLNREHRDADNVCHTELADHLPNMLRLIAKMKNIQMRNEIAERLIIPALDKMISEFDSDRIKKKDEVYKKHLKTVLDFSDKYRTVYVSLLTAINRILKKDFNAVESCSNSQANTEGHSCSCKSTAKDFSDNLNIELTIEKEK